jgi:Xaa-Pro aminopeptidase
MSSDVYAFRRGKLAKAINKMELDGLLVTNPTNVTYLTGFSGEDSYLLCGNGIAVLVSDGRFTLQIREECPDLEAFIRPSTMTMPTAVAKVVQKLRWSKLGFEAESLSVQLHSRLGETLKNITLVATTKLVEKLRIKKDPAEIEHIRAAAAIAERAFSIIRAGFRPTQTEQQIQTELEYHMRRLGANGVAFPSIVAAGPRAALPHAVPTDRPVGEAHSLLVDWGARSAGYCCDLTRVLVRTRIPPKLRRIYQVVLRAQQKAIEAIRPGVPAREVDRAARAVIEEAHFGRYFNHGLGHGVGLQVHEEPRLSPTSQDVLEPGMVVTVEPGIYLPGFGGVRLEDDVLVTRDGCEVLTRVAKELEEMLI